MDKKSKKEFLLPPCRLGLEYGHGSGSLVALIPESQQVPLGTCMHVFCLFVLRVGVQVREVSPGEIERHVAKLAQPFQIFIVNRKMLTLPSKRSTIF